MSATREVERSRGDPGAPATGNLVDLMASGVDVLAAAKARRGPPESDPRALVRLMRTGVLPRDVAALDTGDGWSAPGFRPIDSTLAWSLAQRLAALITLLCFTPILPFVWAGVRLGSRGPLLFRQRRRGRNGEPFTIYKLRTLTVGAESDTTLGVSQRDPQITRFGRLLRTLKIDEVPQLWNVVRGDMEFVGPRPIPIALEDRLRQEIHSFSERNRVRPGLTSLAQIAVVDNGLGDRLVEDWGERFQAELHYIRRKSFAYDSIVIGLSALYIVRLFVKVLRGTPRKTPRQGVATATEVLGVKIANLTPTQVVERIAGWVGNQTAEYVAFCPVHSIVEAVHWPTHRAALHGAGMCTADGMPIVWAQRLLGHRRAERVYGPTTMLRTLERAERDGWRVAFYGGAQHRLDQLVREMTTRFPALQVVSAISPPFRQLTPEEDVAMTRRLASARPDVVLVGLGCPKQERWMAEHCDRVQTVMLGVGAAFDFHAGALRQAPRFVQAIGMEWFFRLCCEPRRLFRRYATTNPAFVLLFASQWFKRTILRRVYQIELDRSEPGPRSASPARPQPDKNVLPMPPGPDIAVCLATYRRPDLLAATLNSLAALELPDGVSGLEVRVVDNDAARSAEATVQTFAERCDDRLAVRYEVEPERNIALARNRALEMGRARRIAFLDDDECADPHWLCGLWKTMEAGHADATFGRVEAALPASAPSWIRRGRFLDKSAGPPGINLSWESARTSSALVDGSWFYDFGFRFDRGYGRSGGEDTDLFRRIDAAGGRLRSAPDSVVREKVHHEQCRLGWFMRRYWRGGANYERLASSESSLLRPLARFLKRVFVSAPLAVVAVPSAVRGHQEHLFAALMNLSRAFGGLSGWLSPGMVARSKGYRSSGIMPAKDGGPLR